MLSWTTQQAYEIFGMNYFPPEPTADNVLMETWEVWTTKNNYRSLWRVTTYESGWMDWWLSNVSTLYAFALVQVLFSTMALWLSFVLLYRSQTIEGSCENKGFGVELFRFLQMGNSASFTKRVWGVWLNAKGFAIARHALEHTTNGGWKIVAALLQLPWLHHAWVQNTYYTREYSKTWCCNHSYYVCPPVQEIIMAPQVEYQPPVQENISLLYRWNNPAPNLIYYSAPHRRWNSPATIFYLSLMQSVPLWLWHLLWPTRRSPRIKRLFHSFY